MADRPYKINRRELTEQEKRDRVEFFNKWNKMYETGEPVADVEAFVSITIYDETVTFICNRCKVEEDIDLDMVDEFGFDETEIPKLYCSHCSKGTMKPKYIISK